LIVPLIKLIEHVITLAPVYFNKMQDTRMNYLIFQVDKFQKGSLMEGAKNIMLVGDMKVTFQIRPQSHNFVGKVTDFHYMCGLKFVPPPFLRRRVINP